MDNPITHRKKMFIAYIYKLKLFAMSSKINMHIVFFIQCV